MEILLVVSKWIPAGLWDVGMQGRILVLVSRKGTQENREEKGALVVVVCFHLKLEGIG